MCCGVLRNGPNPGIGHCRGRCRDRLLGRFAVLASPLKSCKGIERSEEITGDGGVVAEIGLPAPGRIDHEANGDSVMRAQVFRAVLDDVPGESTFVGGGDVEDTRLDTARPEAAPVGLGEAQDERVFGRVVRLEGLAEAAEDFLVFMLVFLGEDYERCRGEAVLQGVQAAALFAGFGLGSAFLAVAAIGLALSF